MGSEDLPDFINFNLLPDNIFDDIYEKPYSHNWMSNYEIVIETSTTFEY